jgi:VWFA-related protein
VRLSGWVFLLAVLGFSASAQSPVSGTSPTFKVGVTNVLVDVVVTDHHGVPVEGLTGDNFVILQDGHPQQVVSFEAHSPASAPITPPGAPLPPGVYTNAVARPTDDNADVLLIDSLNTPVENQVRSHQLLVDYLKTLPLKKPVAVFILTGQLQQLEDFTTDHSALLRTVERLAANPQKSALLKTQEDKAQDMKDEDKKLEESLGMQKQHAYLATQQMKALQQVNAERDSFSTNLRIQYTLAAFNQLASYLTGMPGRKNVIWVSGSFPLSIMPDFDLKNPFQAARNFTPEVTRTTRLLANARVAIYPIDARGLFPESNGAAVEAGSAVRNPDRIAHAQSQEFAQQAQEQMSLEKVAHDTGGKAIYNTNDLKGAFGEVDRDGSHYYTLAYVPADRTSADKPHAIEVRVAPGKYHLSYRRSYIPPRAEDVNGGRNFVSRMQHDVPASTEIIFRLSPTRIAPEPAAAAIAGSNPKAPRPLIRYSIDYQVDGSAFVLTPSPDGTLQGAATLLSIVYDREGKPLNSASGTLQIHVPAAQYAAFLKQGIHHREQLDIPLQAISLRAGVFDPVSGRTGSLEVLLPPPPGHPAP